MSFLLSGNCRYFPWCCDIKDTVSVSPQSRGWICMGDEAWTLWTAVSFHNLLVRKRWSNCCTPSWMWEYKWEAWRRSPCDISGALYTPSDTLLHICRSYYYTIHSLQGIEKSCQIETSCQRDSVWRFYIFVPWLDAVPPPSFWRIFNFPGPLVLPPVLTLSRNCCKQHV